MGARAVSLYLRDAPFKKLFRSGHGLCLGPQQRRRIRRRNEAGGQDFIGAVFSPTGTKDFSPYITKIRQSGADAMYFALAGDDLNAFLVQAKQYRLGEKVRS